MAHLLEKNLNFRHHINFSNPFKLSCVTGKTKSLTSDERWEGPGLINGGAAHPIRLGFWGEGNGPVTSGIRANPDPTLMSHQAPQRVG